MGSAWELIPKPFWCPWECLYTQLEMNTGHKACWGTIRRTRAELALRRDTLGGTPKNLVPRLDALGVGGGGEESCSQIGSSWETPTKRVRRLGPRGRLRRNEFADWVLVGDSDETRSQIACLQETFQASAYFSDIHFEIEISLKCIKIL